MNVPPLSAPKLHRLSVWQLVLSVIGLILTLFSLLGILAINLIARSSSTFSGVDTTQLNKYLWVLLLIAALSLPSIILSIRRLSGKASAEGMITNKHLYIVSALILLWVGCLWLGSKADAWNLAAAITSVINLAIVALPILLWVTVGRYKLLTGSQQRGWGMVNFSIFLSAPLITLVEILFIVFLAILGISSLAQNADLMPYLQVFQSQGQLDPVALNSLISKLSPMLNQPGFYALVALVFCLFVPIIEELFKPLAVWTLAGKKLTPAEGWAAGLLCGAAFGLIESLSLMNVATGDIWLVTAIGRVGTGLLHTFTAGLSGYALAKTWQDRHFMRISLVYLAVILLHGSWNFFAILMGLSQMAFPISVPALSVLMSVSTWVLGSLAVLMAAGILVINYLLRKQQSRLQFVPPVLPVVQAEPEEHTA